jgi:hypothetical protein
MAENDALHEYLVLSRGQWDADKSPAEVQAAIDAFYVWYARLVADGRAKPGSRLATQVRLVSRHRVTDGPFTEAKEVVGGYWTFLARSLDDAARLAAENPCLACGLLYEIRPIESKRASAFETTNENLALGSADAG